MKLFTRYNRINLFATVVVFLLSGIAYYFLLRFVLISQVDEDLKIEQHEIQTYVAKYNHLPEIIAVKDQHTSYLEVDKDGGKRKFLTIKMKDVPGTNIELFRELIFYMEVSGNWHEVSVSKSLEGTDDMVQLIITITLITILMILVVSVLINRLVLKKLWKPFYDSLAVLRSFELGRNKPPQFAATNINEFAAMNETLRHSMQKANDDYQHLKEFTENASHELQTPLAIIRSKLDVLIQDEHLSEQQSKSVQGAYEAIQRLARINQGLLLLTKIENGQYAEVTAVNLSEKIKEKLIQFEEMIASKNIAVTTALDEAVQIKINPELADIILNNLFSNAIKYNLSGGVLDIIVDEGLLEISNTSPGNALDENRLFRRFAKSGQAEEGIGLGLAIVKQAAAFSGFEINYEYEKKQHHFILIQKKY